MFAAAGVERAFGIPGVHNLPFWRDRTEAHPPIIGVRHEQTTVYAADGLARATGRPAVALTTTGPGAANAAGAFGEAASCGSPVVLVASEVNSRFLAEPGVKGVLHQSRDQAAIFEPLAKAVYRPRTPEAAISALEDAFRTCMEYPRGPVYIDVPTDLLSAPAPQGRVVAPDRPALADDTALADLVRLLDDSASVVIWAGAGIVQSEAEAELLRLAEGLQAPVVTTYGARGAVPLGHPSHIALPPHEPEVADLIESADLLLAVGTDFDGMMTRNWTMPMPERLAVVNCDATDLRKNYAPDVAVLGDAREVLTALSARITRDRRPTTHSEVAEAGFRRLEDDEVDHDGLAFVRALDEVVDERIAVVCDMAVAGYWFGGYGSIHRSRQLQYPVGWGTLGYALPAAVGPASVGTPTLGICGDGGVLFGLAEFATIAQEALPVTMLVVDDSAYGMLAYDQVIAGDERAGVDLQSPDWVSLGQAFGIPTVVTADTGQLQQAVRDGLVSEKPALVVLKGSFTPPRTTSARWKS
ncbi:thiamine pyrophosphate-binding protein [Nocardioides daejeonensis]|uniref:thiamine pyrophosphate-binding protein n=1 Tax=Nocardioides daejeonensis TaxID=1046556 RepID=UPI001EF613A8